MKQRKKGMQEMNEVARNEGANELSEDALDAVTGGGYYNVELYNKNNGKFHEEKYETLTDAIEWAKYSNQTIVSKEYVE